jgi:ArsR family transcriptional regulator
MNEYTTQATLLKAMGHPVRLRILDMLRRGETCVCHIERVLGKRQAYVSQQLMALRDAGLVESRKDGLQVFYRIVDDRAADILRLLYGMEPSGLEVINGCTCPACSTVLITEIE